MGVMASQITSLTTVYLTVYQTQIKENIKAPRHWPLCGEFTGPHRWPVNSPHKWPVRRKLFPFDDVIILQATQWQHIRNLFNETGEALTKTHQFFHYHLPGTAFTKSCLSFVMKIHLFWETTIFSGRVIQVPQYFFNKIWIVSLRTVCGIELWHTSHNAPVTCPTMHHFGTQMCTCVHISVTIWCIVGYLSNALWEVWVGSIGSRIVTLSKIQDSMFPYPQYSDKNPHSCPCIHPAGILRVESPWGVLCTRSPDYSHALLSRKKDSFVTSHSPIFFPHKSPVDHVKEFRI